MRVAQAEDPDLIPYIISADVQRAFDCGETSIISIEPWSGFSSRWGVRFCLELPKQQGPRMGVSAQVLYSPVFAI
jgi:hypothetical protein